MLDVSCEIYDDVRSLVYYYLVLRYTARMDYMMIDVESLKRETEKRCTRSLERDYIIQNGIKFHD